jgi:hypothetical protein|tara:strand:- start:413 stop:775 length:363 start_codon:yes stop_codon:yes gene_type:complete
MSQRVSIQYSVDLDELGIEVQRLIEGSLVQIQHMVGKCNQIEQTDPLTIKNCDLINDIRQHLSKADQTLNDVTNIISGYLTYKSNITQDTTDSSQLSNELSQKMEDFKHSIDPPPDEVPT